VAERFQAPKGTFDVTPEQAPIRRRIEAAAADVLERAGFSRIETPTFEATELFSRAVGQSTDIVRKEMFTFDDLGGRSLSLRPEGTAPICRAYIEHGMHKWGQPVKLWYSGSFYRYEAPQAGRYREFHQVGAETIGSESPLADAELIVALDEWLRGLGVIGLRLRLSSLGSPASRSAYREELEAFLRQRQDELSADARARIDDNPLRAFDADDPGTRAVMSEAPMMLDRLDGEDAEHFATVRELLDSSGVAYELDGTLVRGLDYYTRTVFEFESDKLGSQSGVAGGGRYDLLIEELGGPPTPAIGWAAGVERIASLMGTPDEADEGPTVFVAAEPGDRERAFALVNELRRTGLRAETDLADRSLKGQMKHADRLGSTHTLILRDGEVQLRDMTSGEQRPIEPDPAQIAEAVGAA
jgi:histidyl-tRNA synthetase